MSNPKDRLRRGTTRLASTLVATAVVGTGAVAASGVAYAEESTPTPKLETFSPNDFSTQAAELPAGLQAAIERDLQISPEQYLANAEAAKVASDVVAKLKSEPIGFQGAEIDGQDLTIYVETEADVAVVEETGATVKVGAPEKPDHSDAEFKPMADHKGGYGYATDNGTSIFRCSAGFSGYDPDGGHRLVTAGHCGFNINTDPYTPLEGPVRHIELDEPIWGTSDWATDYPGQELGELVEGSFQYGDGDDAGLIDLNDDWAGIPQVAGWDGGDGDPDLGSVTIYDTIDAVAGVKACKSGATSGWTCGEIVDTDHQPKGYPVRGFTFQVCMLGGDSGGSIVVGNYALGVNSGSTWEQEDEDGDPFASCDPSLQADDNPLLGIGYALSDGTKNVFDFYGDQWELNVEVNTPKVDSPEDGAETSATPTFTGTVDKAGANHRVRVTIDGTPYEGDVNADGEFDVKVSDELDPDQEYSYEVKALYGNHSESGIAEGSFTVTEAPEPEVEDLTVGSPTEGQKTGNSRPPFEGTGQPGAEVTLRVGDEEFGTATVGDDGNWKIEPDADLPGGTRFDATVTQVAGEDTQSVTVPDLGIELADVTVTMPEDGDDVSDDVVFTGTSFPGASIELSIEGAVAPSDDVSPSSDFNAASGEFGPAEDEADEGASQGSWEGEFEIDEDGNWTFTPDEPLEDGEYTLTARAWLDGGDPELSESEAVVSFTVTAGGEDLPDTGSSSLPMILVGVGLLAAGGAALAIRARRNTTGA